jgi:Flp pilus assembly protein TadG
MTQQGVCNGIVVASPRWLRTTVRDPSSNRRFARRAGGILVIVSLLLVAIVAFGALAIDLGYTRLVRAELRNAADTAALAAAGTLRDTHNEAQARAAAVQYGAYNRAAGSPVQIDSNSDVLFGQRVYNAATATWSFVPGQSPYDSVQVKARRTSGSLGGPVGMFFGRALNRPYAETAASAVATYLPRDIALVIDLSGSMLYDSTLLHESNTTINNQAVWTALGSPKFGNMQNWSTLTTYSSGSSTSTILSSLGLTSVSYPYAGGSWSEYVSFVKSDSRLPSTYRNKYGLKTWLDYVLQNRSFKSSTPLLSSTPEQPVTALKSALDIMIDYLETLDTEEWVSMSTFDTYNRVEVNLTGTLSTVRTNIWDKQAGHYARETNIGGGILSGRSTLNGGNARAGARKVMILFSDGVANEPGTDAEARQYAVDQATLASQEDIVIHCISFSSLADTALMAQIAQIGRGVHCYVPGDNMDQYTQQLRDVILNVSSIRPLALTK